MNVVSSNSNNLTKLLYEITEINKDTLKLYSYFLSGNKNFKYNKSYLDNLINNFENVVKEFKKRADLVEDYCECLRLKYLPGDWIIIIDDIFIIDNDYNLCLLNEYVNRDDLHLSRLLGKYDEFNLYTWDSKKIKLKYINIKDDIDYTFFCDDNKKIIFNELISEYFKEKEGHENE